MSLEKVTVIAGAFTNSEWEEVTIRAALNEAARNFDLMVSEAGALPLIPFVSWPLLPNTPVTVLAGATPMVAGYVDDYMPSGRAGAHIVHVAGRGKGADYVDCSCVHPTGTFENKTLIKIAQELDVYGVGIQTDVDPGKPLPIFQIRQGSSPHAEMMRILPQHKLTMKGQADGSIMITRAGTKRHSSGLIHGVNIEDESGTLTARHRFSDYIVKGQSSIGNKKEHLQPKGEAKDGAVPRYRPKIILEKAETDSKRAKERAEWEKARAAGYSAKATITVIGWRDSFGTPWEPGWLVFVYSPWLKIEQDMLIESVDFNQSKSGTTSTINVIDPRAYAGNKPGASASGSEWSLD